MTDDSSTGTAPSAAETENPNSLQVGVARLPHGAGLPLPSHATAQAAGLDLAAAIDAPMVLEPGSRCLVPTGLVLHLPPGYEGQIRPRSGLALKHGLTCLNAPGTIDADYRGEIGVILINHGPNAVTVERGMRIAQLVIAPVLHATLFDIDRTAAEPEAGGSGARLRGTGGFGSTGTSGADSISGNTTETKT
ncbi:dUTP diphosphatase [Fodinicurvata sp. EGI_FJ10296]|uniref:dUTP diphosphatase n=1 Tax=Fodinicurvata sp. EGI_FJ10296 TaxID=3231908 RepID=UPI003455F664